MTIKTALLSLQALLCAPEPNDPQDAEVASMYKKDRTLFVQTARFWAETYAIERDEGAEAREAAVLRVASMGFSEDAARQALTDNSWDENAAVNALLS